MDRTSIIQSLSSHLAAESYLEVGLGDGAHFSQIPIARKCSVDPSAGRMPASTPTHQLTSDAFFAANQETFDLIFIDGLHHAETVKRDITNALAVLRPGGVIVCHDMNPSTDEMQRVPREQVEWTGDCWRAWVGLRQERGDLQMFVIDTDYGVGVIYPNGEPKTPRLQLPAGKALEEMSFDDFEAHRGEWLPLIAPSEFFATLQIPEPAPASPVHPPLPRGSGTWTLPRQGRGERPFLVYCPTNAGDFIADLLNENRLFDVALNDFSGTGTGIDGAEWQFSRRGHKWPCIARNLSEIDRTYEAYAFLDNDVEISAEGLNSLFLIGSSLGLDLFQAALTHDSVCGHPHLKQKADSYVRKSDFVEVMMPVFSYEGLARCAPTFGDSESGWGLNRVWPWYLDQGRIGIIDAVTARPPAQ